MNVKYFYIMIFGFFSSSCANIPNGATVVEPFDLSRYVGKWYEIARFDFRFEKGLNNTTAEYSVNANGTVKVVNRGYDYNKRKWKEAIGVAKFTSSPNRGKLKVSFFGPFYGAYNIIAIDKDYKYVLIVGKNLDYIWILAREKQIPERIKNDYVEKAASLGFDISKLIWVEHNI